MALSTTAPFKYNHIVFFCSLMLLILPYIRASNNTRSFQICSDDYSSQHDAEIWKMVDDGMAKLSSLEPDVNVGLPAGQEIGNSDDNVGGFGARPQENLEFDWEAVQAEWKKLDEQREQLRQKFAAENPDNNPGRIRFLELEISPEVEIPGEDATIIIKADRGELIPQDTVAVDMELVWMSLMTSNSSRFEFSLCKSTNISCPIAAKDQFIASFTLPMPVDVFAKFRAQLRITPRNISNGFILSCITTELRVAFLPRSKAPPPPSLGPAAAPASPTLETGL